MNSRAFLILPLLALVLSGCGLDEYVNSKHTPNCVGQGEYWPEHKYYVVDSYVGECTVSGWAVPKEMRGTTQSCFCQELKCSICGKVRRDCNQ